MHPNYQQQGQTVLACPDPTQTPLCFPLSPTLDSSNSAYSTWSLPKREAEREGPKQEGG